MNTKFLLFLLAILCAATHIRAQQTPAPECPEHEKGSVWIRLSSAVIEGLVQSKVLPGAADVDGAGVERIRKSDVPLKVQFDKSGKVICVVALGGNPLLIPRSIEAARKWTLRPYTLNGAAINVESGLVFRFKKGKVTALFPYSWAGGVAAINQNSMRPRLCFV
jgi:hypothetical protein